MGAIEGGPTTIEDICIGAIREVEEMLKQFEGDSLHPTQSALKNAELIVQLMDSMPAVRELLKIKQADIVFSKNGIPGINRWVLKYSIGLTNSSKNVYEGSLNIWRNEDGGEVGLPVNQSTLMDLWNHNTARGIINSFGDMRQGEIISIIHQVVMKTSNKR